MATKDYACEYEQLDSIDFSHHFPIDMMMTTTVAQPTEPISTKTM